MEWIYGLDHIQDHQAPSVVTIGNFDGIHLGHRELIKKAKERAEELCARCVLCTFSPHPATLFSPQRGLKRLYNIEDLESPLRGLGVDLVLIEAFTKEFASQTAKAFVKRLLVEGLNTKALVVGADFRYGAGREGDVEKLKIFGDEFGFTVDVIRPVKSGDQIVSSSLIRQCLSEGRVESATQYLGRPFSVHGSVIHGEGRGQKLGYPTANVQLASPTSPALGVYAGSVRVKKTTYPCVINVGKRPTFKSQESEMSFEVHILDQELNLYGQEVQVFLEYRLRDELKFSSGDELIKQIALDIEKARVKLGAI